MSLLITCLLESDMFFADVNEPCCGRLALEQLAELGQRIASLHDDKTPHIVFCRELPHFTLKRPGARRQVKIRVASLSPTLDQSRFVLLLLFVGQPPSEELRRDECYIIEASQWNAAPVLPADRCKVFHLDRLRLLSSSVSNDMIIDAVPTLSLELVWRESSIEGLLDTTGHGTSLVRYIQLLVDLAVQPKLATSLSVKQIIDEYAEYRRQHREEHAHGEAVIGFLYALTRHVHEKTRRRNLLERVIHTESLLHGTTVEGEISLWEFVYASCSTRLPVWLSHYRIDDDNGLYWSLDDRTQRYTVHSDWLLKMAGYHCDITALRGGARLELDEATFTNHFMPALYRELCLDLFTWVKRGGKQTLLDNLLDATLPAYDSEEAQSALFDALPIGDRRFSLVTCYDFACEYGSAGTVAVEALERRLALIEYNKTHAPPTPIAQLRLSTEAIERDGLPDIENLVASLPPCLHAMLGEPGRHLANMDRYNATSYLAEMQFTKDEIVEYLTPLNGSSSSSNPIASNYDSFQRRRLKNSNSSSKSMVRYDTLSCNAVITRERRPQEVFLCPYARQQKQGRDYTDDEKLACRTECHSAMFGRAGQLYHPLDYVYATLNKKQQ